VLYTNNDLDGLLDSLCRNGSELVGDMDFPYANSATVGQDHGEGLLGVFVLETLNLFESLDWILTTLVRFWVVIFSNNDTCLSCHPFSFRRSDHQ